MNEFGLGAIGPNGKLASPSRGGNATSNGVLAALSPEALGRLKPFLRERFFRDGHVLWKGGERPDRVYFPVSGMISLVVATKPGAALEVGSVGLEGAIGFDGGADAPTAPASAVVHASGTFVHMPAREFAAASRQSEELRRVELVCREWILAQAQLGAVCNAVHSADARFGRWLARAAEAIGSDVVAVTQEVAAEMLGLRRTTVTLIAQNLQAAGIIRYRRGVITILNHAALRGAACSCSASLGPSRWPSRLVASRADGGGADRPSAEPANRSA
ncbi:Crp/Fnr family transcriptional regulator [Rhodoplanes serenus]|uniref:Crp/Fnr family transcriptional regulator n=1 Tax=Rhodoplanes serenus TaxID=200615 RepID=UPI000DAEDFB2|nr:Crp/Fnr family transcriptional regulator [Rhodoplanes serenus]RAI33677.1 hypothetical protein CH340_11490 [Rhodoplanes serenus]